MGAAPRVLYLPNESKVDQRSTQIGGRAAFQEMAEDGTIRELSVYSYLADYKTDGKKERSNRALVEAVRAFQPDILFWQHPQDFPLDAKILPEIRGCGSNPLVVYHEADPSDRLYKPIFGSQKILYRFCDMFFSVGLGAGRWLWQELRDHPHFYFCPSSVDRERFAEPAEPGRLGSRYDAIMLGTIPKKWRVIKQPQSDRRVAIARGLTQLFGDRYASFGYGFPAGTNGQGPFPYEGQRELIQQCRMSVIWDFYPDYTFYFSDRLPIALASGVPFITSTHGGYDTLFKNVPGLFHGSSVNEILDIAVYLRGLPLEEIAEMGRGGRAWMLENLEARVVFRRAFATCLRVWKGEP